MDARRFDALTKYLATRFSRRAVLRASATGLTATSVRGWSAAAQATPSASGAASGLAENNATYFVQTATGGTFRPNPQAAPAASPAPATPTAATHGAYLLTLTGHNGETIGFSDRPERQFGEVDTPRFFTGLGFVPTNPPNAALVADLPGQPDAVVLVELLNPQ